MRDEVHRLYPTCGFEKQRRLRNGKPPENDRAARVARHAREVVRAREKLGRADELLLLRNRAARAHHRVRALLSGLACEKMVDSMLVYEEERRKKHRAVNQSIRLGGRLDGGNDVLPAMRLRFSMKRLESPSGGSWRRSDREHYSHAA